MKKITFILFTLISFIGFSQSWDFTNDAQGWTTTAADLVVNANSVTLTSKGANNPGLNQAAANVDASALSIIAVTIKNSANGPTFMRAHYPKAASGRVYKAVAIENALTEFKTYYIDLTNAEWTGIVNDIKIQFKDDNNTGGGANYTSTGETIEIDKIEFLSEIPKEEIISFTFDTDAQGWEALSSSVSVSNGVLKIIPNVGESAKIINTSKTINASKYKFVEVRYKNLSVTNNEIRFQFKHAADNFTGFKGTNQAINGNSTDFEILEIDLSATAEWSGNTQDFQIIIRDTNNDGNTASVGDLQIDSITFKETSTLSVNNEILFNGLSIYPNPSNGLVNIQTTTKLSKVQLFNLIGKKVFETQNLNTNMNTINVTSLNKGIYLLRLQDENNKTKTQKLIIK
jgi:hypothetical protein